MPTTYFEDHTYVTVEEAETYLGNRPEGVLWCGLTTANKEAYLIKAFDHLSAFVRLSDTDDSQNLKDAQCLEAYAISLVAADTESIERYKLRQQGVKLFQFNSQKEEYFEKSKSGRALLSDDAFRVLKPILVANPTRVFF